MSVDIGQPLRVEVTGASAASMGLEEGGRVVCVIKALAVRWGNRLS